MRVAAQACRDGVAFFRRAKTLSADPRVKFIFGRAADEYARALGSLEDLPGGKGKAKETGIFPFAEYERIECYVCGHQAKGEEPPEVCPGCGAARYAFERDVPREKAWDLVARTTKEALAAIRRASTGGKAGAKESYLAAMTVLKSLVEESKEERARIAAAA